MLAISCGGESEIAGSESWRQQRSSAASALGMAATLSLNLHGKSAPASAAANGETSKRKNSGISWRVSMAARKSSLSPSQTWRQYIGVKTSAGMGGSIVAVWWRQRKRRQRRSL